MRKKILFLIVLFLLVIPFATVHAKPVLPECENPSDIAVKDVCTSCGHEWNASKNKCVVISTSKKVSCGTITGIPRKIPQLTSLAVTMIQIAVPIILVIVGSIDLLKAVGAQKEEEITKARKILGKRLLVAGVIFFLIVIGKFLISVVADQGDKTNIIDCMDCFLSNDCDS